MKNTMVNIKKADLDFFDSFYSFKAEESNIFWSGYTEKPSYDKLLQWFKKELNNSNRIIFKIEMNNIDVGYLYFDFIDKNIVELSYGVSEKYTGKGIATSAIKKAISFSKKYYSFYDIVANVFSENIGSIKALLRNNFKKTGKQSKKYLAQLNEYKIMDEYIYKKNKVFIIAEAGVNHNGDINLAKKLIDKAFEAKVDAIKFQTWKTELLVTEKAEQAQYQVQNTNTEESQFDMLKRLELSYEDFKELKKYCDSKNIMFLSTADELQSADFLSELQDIFKIGSGEINNFPYLRHIGSLQKKVILSTGMARLDEISDALDILMKFGTKKEDITVLHANTEYPTPFEDVNLKAMLTIGKALDVKFGYSDHTLGIEVAIAAVAMGASIIEKHFTLDKTMQGPDHKASLEPNELKSMVSAIRNIEVSLGDGIKIPSNSEIKNIKIVRKSIVAKKDIKKGDLLTKENLTVKRPGNGVSPMKWDEVIGTKAKKDYKEDELI